MIQIWQIDFKINDKQSNGYGYIMMVANGKANIIALSFFVFGSMPLAGIFEEICFFYRYF
ncbi:hypothetical protein [Companilactobacillus muriivasis]|uniref:hypothetical protein n=1 Tax=Companilactobacillus muriivasis TaxID=3081444 RepID=UPI0030C67631